MGLTKQNFYEKKEEPKVQKDEYDGVIDFTFDDGFAFDMRTADLLEKYGLKGTFFVIVDRVGQDGFLTWQQIQELHKRGHKIGSHTNSHPSDLKLLYDDQLHYEIQNSKDMLETVLGDTVSRFCYPRGRYDDRVRGFVATAGYTYARTTGKPGVMTSNNHLAMPGTVHIFQRAEYEGTPILDFAKRCIDQVKKTGLGYCGIFGHGNEIERDNNWGVLEEVIKYVVA